LSLLQNSNAISTGVTGYNLESSLRFRRSASAYLSRTPTTAGNQKTWTWSGWIKRGNLSSSQFIFEAGTTQNETNILLFTTQGKILFRTVVASIEVTNLNTTAVYRDSSAWYHIIVAVDTTQATSSNRIKLYVNGSQVTTFDTATYQSQNSNTYVNSTVSHAMGRRPYQDSGHFDGYMTEVNFVDGQALTPSDFGEYDENTGVWKPKEYTGTYGTNGFHLPFTEAQASGFTDHFTDLTGGQNVQVADNALIEPGSGNFCLEFWCRPDTLNGVQENYICKGSSGYASYIIGRYSGTSGDGTLTMYGSSSGSSWDVFNNEVFGTVSAGSWHHLAFYRIGNNFYGAVNGNVRFIKTYSGAIWNNGNNLFIGTDGGGGSQSDIDVSNFRFVKGNSVYGTSNFTPPTAPLTAISGTTLLTCNRPNTFADESGNITITANGNAFTGQYDFFIEDNNTDGTITSTVRANPASGFSVVTYTGTGANATVGHGLGVAPSMIIAKARGTPNGIARSWFVYHTTLGASAFIYLNLTNAAVTGNSTVWQGVTPTSTVFSLGTEPSVNWSGSTYVAYCFHSVEGFSKIGTYTGNGSADGPFVYTGFRPAFVVAKRTDLTSSWQMWDTSRSTYNATTHRLRADLSDAEDTGAVDIDTLSNGFKLRNTGINSSGGTYIYMAFAENPFKQSLAR